MYLYVKLKLNFGNIVIRYQMWRLENVTVLQFWLNYLGVKKRIIFTDKNVNHSVRNYRFS